MGESLAASWLKHVHKCQIVQLNWKPSSEWKSTFKDNELSQKISERK